MQLHNRFRFLCLLCLSAALVGCGRGPLKKLRTHPGCPWSGPGQQLQEGERSMGQSAYGNIWRKFWRDASGREYDPERVAEQAWKYLESTGDVAKIKTARAAKECSPWMRIASVDPVVVLQIPCQHNRFADTGELQFHGTQSGLELSFAPDTEMYSDESVSWWSPDLKQAPTPLTFTDGVAEISLPNGKLILTQDGERCKVRRE